MMRCCFAWLLIALGTIPAFAQDTDRMAQIGEAAAADNRFMGSILVSKAGVTVFEQTYGFANLEWKIPFTPNTKFRIGSVTKQFTAAAILILQEQGKLQLDDLVSKHFPDAPVSWNAVTLHHLLTHTSGIPSVTSQPDYATWKLSPTTPRQTLAHVRERRLEFTPGEKFAYSNSGYILLGAIVEHASGTTYEAFLAEHIFQPLGMSDSGLDSNASLIPERAAGYVPGPNGLSNARYIHMQLPHGAGALYSTTRDLVRWADGVFGGKLLTPASLQKMLTPRHNDYALGVAVETTKDRRALAAADLANWRKIPNMTGRKVVQHAGAIEGFNSHLAYYPESKITIAVLSNVEGSASSELASQLASVAFGEPVILRLRTHSR